MHEFDDSIRQCTATVIAIEPTMWQHRTNVSTENNFFFNEDVTLKRILKTLEYPHYTTIVLYMWNRMGPREIED